MKAKLALVGVLVAVLALVGVGCTDAEGMEIAGKVKVTAGGWFYKDPFQEPLNEDSKVTFGFNAQYDVEKDVVKGQFQLVDHVDEINIHGTFDTFKYLTLWDGFCVVKAEGELDGQSGVPFELAFMDMDEDPDMTGALLIITISTSPELFYVGYLEGGNIQLHE